MFEMLFNKEFRLRFSICSLEIGHLLHIKIEISFNSLYNIVVILPWTLQAIRKLLIRAVQNNDIKIAIKTKTKTLKFLISNFE